MLFLLKRKLHDIDNKFLNKFKEKLNRIMNRETTVSLIHSLDSNFFW